MKTRTLFKSFFIVAWAAMSLGVVVSCKEKPRTTDIIVKKPTPKPKKGVQKMDEYRQVRDVEWLGGTYKVVAERKPDTSLPQAVRLSSTVHSQRPTLHSMLTTTMPTALCLALCSTVPMVAR